MVFDENRKVSAAAVTRHVVLGAENPFFPALRFRFTLCPARLQLRRRWEGTSRIMYVGHRPPLKLSQVDQRLRSCKRVGRRQRCPGRHDKVKYCNSHRRSRAHGHACTPHTCMHIHAHAHTHARTARCTEPMQSRSKSCRHHKAVYRCANGEQELVSMLTPKLLNRLSVNSFLTPGGKKLGKK